jgi:hypothetical protein
MASLSQVPRTWPVVRLIAAAVIILYGGIASPAPLEQAIQASYVTKFAPFVEWPANAFASASSPFIICLSGHDTFGPTLDDLARGQTVRGRPMQVRRIPESGSVGGCHILVIGAGTSPAAIAEAAGKPMLTITGKTSGVNGGIINFVAQAGRVRFEIDNGAARAAHLTISSKLLGLAVKVVS